MPAKDKYHDAVVHALEKSGWTSIDEQVTLTIEDRTLWIDIEASKSVAGLVILVEVKKLTAVPSEIEALANAIGKFFLY